MYSSVDTRFQSLDELHDRMPGRKLYLEDLAKMTDEEVNSHLLTIVDVNDVDNVPVCMCGETVGHLLLECPHCGTEPIEPISAPILPSLWMRAPAEIGQFISPIALHFLTSHYVEKGENFVDYLCDARYKPANPDHRVYHALREANIPAGDFSYFINHLFEVLDVLNSALASREWTPSNIQLYHLLKDNQDKVFSSYLPVPSKAIFVLEKSSAGNKGDNHTALVVDAVRTMLMITKEGIRKTKNRIPTLCYRSQMRLVGFYRSIVKKVGKKEQLIRKHIYGSKSAWVGRAVVTSITVPHRYDEMYLPWSLSVSLFQLQIASWLFDNTDMSGRECRAFINEQVNQYHPLMENAINAVLALRGPRHYLEALLNRNPTIKRLGIMLMDITKVKTDVNDYTISVPAQNLKGGNCDFDGDQLNIKLAISDREIKQFEPLKPHYAAWDNNRPFSLSSSISHQPQVIMLWNRFLEGD